MKIKSLSGFPKEKTSYYNENDAQHNLTYNSALTEVGKMELEGDIDKMVDFMLTEMDIGKRTPDYVFHKPLYPSSGVERMAEQEKQVRDFIKALLADLSWLRVKKGVK